MNIKVKFLNKILAKKKKSNSILKAYNMISWIYPRDARTLQYM